MAYLIRLLQLRKRPLQREAFKHARGIISRGGNTNSIHTVTTAIFENNLN